MAAGFCRTPTALQTPVATIAANGVSLPPRHRRQGVADLRVDARAMCCMGMGRMIPGGVEFRMTKQRADDGCRDPLSLSLEKNAEYACCRQAGFCLGRP